MTFRDLVVTCINEGYRYREENTYYRKGQTVKAKVVVVLESLAIVLDESESEEIVIDIDNKTFCRRKILSKEKLELTYSNLQLINKVFDCYKEIEEISK